MIPVQDPTAKLTQPIAYEARPTRMFGAYAIWAIYADGCERQVGHGTPEHCLREAARLNRALPDVKRGL